MEKVRHNTNSIKIVLQFSFHDLSLHRIYFVVLHFEIVRSFLKNTFTAKKKMKKKKEFHTINLSQKTKSIYVRTFFHLQFFLFWQIAARQWYLVKHKVKLGYSIISSCKPFFQIFFFPFLTAGSGYTNL